MAIIPLGIDINQKTSNIHEPFPKAVLSLSGQHEENETQEIVTEKSLLFNPNLKDS